MQQNDADLLPAWVLKDSSNHDFSNTTQESFPQPDQHPSKHFMKGLLADVSLDHCGCDVNP